LALGSDELEGKNADTEGRGDWIKTNQGIACCIVGVSLALLVYLATREWAFHVLRDGFRLDFFTAVAVFTMLICALTMVFERHRHETDKELTQSRWMDWVIAAATTANWCFGNRIPSSGIWQTNTETARSIRQIPRSAGAANAGWTGN
jgi:hypothetical protein